MISIKFLLMKLSHQENIDLAKDNILFWIFRKQFSVTKIYNIRNFCNYAYHTVSSLDIFQQAFFWIRFEDVIEYVSEPSKALSHNDISIWLGKWVDEKELNPRNSSNPFPKQH